MHLFSRNVAVVSEVSCAYPRGYPVFFEVTRRSFVSHAAVVHAHLLNFVIDSSISSQSRLFYSYKQLNSSCLSPAFITHISPVKATMTSWSATATSHYPNIAHFPFAGPSTAHSIYDPVQTLCSSFLHVFTQPYTNLFRSQSFQSLR